MIVGVYGNEQGSAAAVIDRSGRLYGAAKAGALVWEGDSQKTRRAIVRLADRARNRAHVKRDAVVAVAVALEGIAFDRDAATIEALVKDALIKDAELAPLVRASNDVEALHMAAFPGRSGVLIEAERRLRIYAKNDAGERYTKVQTAGSAYSLGRDAMQAANMALDGVGEPTLLAEQVARAYAVQSSADMFGYVYTVGIPAKETVDMVPDVVAASYKGDTVASRLIEHTLRDVIAALTDVLDHIDMPKPYELSFGGKLLASREMARGLRRHLLRTFPESRLGQADLDPDLGACLLGLSLVEDNIGLAASVLRQQRS
jgi:N-acetylglucosamine kinase-like BadF-type ATPase